MFEFIFAFCNAASQTPFGEWLGRGGFLVVAAKQLAVSTPVALGAGFFVRWALGAG